jgi:hypothetical protein
MYIPDGDAELEKYQPNQPAGRAKIERITAVNLLFLRLFFFADYYSTLAVYSPLAKLCKNFTCNILRTLKKYLFNFYYTNVLTQNRDIFYNTFDH